MNHSCRKAGSGTREEGSEQDDGNRVLLHKHGGGNRRSQGIAAICGNIGNVEYAQGNVNAETHAAIG